MPDAVMTEDGAWIFTFDDGIVTEIRVGDRIGLVMDQAFIGIENRFQLHVDGASYLVPPGKVVHEVAPVLPLLHQRVSSARAFKGVLAVTFESGALIEVGVNASGLYEQWQVELSEDRIWVGIGTEVAQPGTYRGQL